MIHEGSRAHSLGIIFLIRVPNAFLVHYKLAMFFTDSGIKIICIMKYQLQETNIEKCKNLKIAS